MSKGLLSVPWAPIMPGLVSIALMPALLAATCAVRLWDPSSGHLRTIFAGHKGKVHDLAFIGSGTLLFSASKDKVFGHKHSREFPAVAHVEWQ